MPATIDVYGKPGCSLCDEALEQLEAFRDRFNFTVARHNIFEDPTWFEKYRFRVPVVIIGGIERLALRFDEQDIEAALIAAGVPRD